MVICHSRVTIYCGLSKFQIENSYSGQSSDSASINSNESWSSPSYTCHLNKNPNKKGMCNRKYRSSRALHGALTSCLMQFSEYDFSKIQDKTIVISLWYLVLSVPLTYVPVYNTGSHPILTANENKTDLIFCPYLVLLGSIRECMEQNSVYSQISDRRPQPVCIVTVLW